MSKTQQGKRDGTGPFKDSAQSHVSDVGKRQEVGEPCPAKKPTAPSRQGDWHDRRSKL